MEQHDNTIPAWIARQMATCTTYEGRVLFDTVVLTVVDRDDMEAGR